MLISVLLCAIFALTSCSAISTDIPSVNSSSDVNPDVGVEAKSDIQSILNPPTDVTENDFEDPNEAPNENLPHVTIWTFPTKRRVFVGDVEIFINSVEDEENSHESIDPQHVLLQHPHKLHLHRNLVDEEDLPEFKVKIKRDQDEVMSSNLKQSINDGPEKIVNYISKLGTDTRKASYEHETDLISHKGIIPGKTIVRRRREWAITDYLHWLLPDFGVTPGSEPSNPITNNENQNKPIIETNKEISDIQEGLVNGIKSNIKDTQDKLTDMSDKGLKLTPVDPQLLKVLREQLKDKRRKRTIDSESNINSLDIKNNEDDDNEESDGFYDDFIKILHSDKDHSSVLISIYYVGK